MMRFAFAAILLFALPAAAEPKEPVCEITGTVSAAIKEVLSS